MLWSCQIANEAAEETAINKIRCTWDMESQMKIQSNHSSEIRAGTRFQFGRNWKDFLASLTNEQINRAQDSLCSMLGVTHLKGTRFLDIGCGSGLFSLSARRLGAIVHSFDYDPGSVACAIALKQEFFPDDSDWIIQEGSVLDAEFLKEIGLWDIVLSWGVLHHTGALSLALANVGDVVAERGQLFIAIYNDQGRASWTWKKVKSAYCKSPQPIRSLILLLVFLRLWGPTTFRDLLSGQPGRSWRNYTERGMSPWHDVVDWVGGLPFEVAKPEEIFSFFHSRGFHLEKLKTCGGGHGCNEFVFSKTKDI